MNMLRQDSRTATPRHVLLASFKWLLAAGFLALVWASSFYLVRHSDLGGINRASDLATLLFGAAAISIFLFTILLASFAVIGWRSLLASAGEAAGRAASDMNQKLGIELRGRMLSYVGYMMGTFSVGEDLFEQRNRDALAEAVRFCQEGYNLLSKIGGPAEFMSLNNLVFYSCVEGDRSRSDFLLKSARRLLDAGQEHNAANLQLTGCRAILQYGQSTEERRKAYEIVAEIATKKNVSERERKEAELYISSFPEP